MTAKDLHLCGQVFTDLSSGNGNTAALEVANRPEACVLLHDFSWPRCLTSLLYYLSCSVEWNVIAGWLHASFFKGRNSLISCSEGILLAMEMILNGRVDFSLSFLNINVCIHQWSFDVTVSWLKLHTMDGRTKDIYLAKLFPLFSCWNTEHFHLLSGSFNLVMFISLSCV